MQDGPVWFLPDVIPGKGKINFSCNVPLGKAILLPITTTFCDRGLSGPLSDTELTECADNILTPISNMIVTVDGERVDVSRFTEDEVHDMLTAMWRGTTSLSTSSKFGQQARLLLKVNYKEDGYIGDLDLKSTLETSATTLENISQVILNIKNLLQTFSDHKDLIESIEYEYSPELVCSLDEEGSNFENIIKPWASKADVKVKRLNL